MAQDVAQETFVKAYLSLHTLQKHEKFGSWIYSIATRISIDFKRKQNRQIRLSTKLTKLPTFSLTEESILHNELRIDVWDALDHLDQTNRTILVLFYICEKSHLEIGKSLNLSVNAVESRLRRNRKLLREDYLASWANHFGDRSKDELVTRVVERIVRQAGQYYIPVSNRMHTTHWFVRHFGLSLDVNGHMLLPMGHTLYLIEVDPAVMAERTISPFPVLIFNVDDSEVLYEDLQQKGVRVEWNTQPDDRGRSFSFFDLDGNRFGIFSGK